MRKRIAYAVVLITAFTSFRAGAACNAPTNATVTPTNITCRGTGVITVSSVLDGASVLSLTDCRYSVYDATNTTNVKPDQSSPVITGLDAGTYVLHIKQICLPSGVSADYTQTVTIGGTYTDPVLGTPTITAPLCAPDNGSISITASKGYGTFQYCMVDSLNAPATPAGYVRPLQGSGTFIGLSGGDYYIRVYDQCNGFVTTKVTVPAAPVLTNPLGNNVLNFSCSNYLIYQGFSRYIPRAAGTLWIDFPDGTHDTLSGTYPGNEAYFNVPVAKLVSYPATVVIHFKDECGNIYNRPYTFNTPDYVKSGSFGAVQYSCTEGKYSVGSPILTDNNNPIYGAHPWDEYSVDGGITWKPYNASDTILVPKGGSRPVMYRGCGGTITYTATVSMAAGQKTLDIGLAQIGGSACDGNASIRIDANTWNGDVNKILVQVIAQPAGQPAIADFYYYADRPRQMINLVPGTYTFKFTDECGATLTKSITLTPVTRTITATPVNICGSNKVGISIQYKTSKGGASETFYWTITDKNGVVVVNSSAYMGNPPAGLTTTGYVVSNLNPGIYTVRMRTLDFGGYVSSDSICPAVFTIDARLPDPLSLNKSIFALCTNDAATGSIVALPQGGVSPYTYTLYKGSVSAGNQVGAPQSSNVFSGLDANEAYVVYVTDKCGAGSSYGNVFGNVKPSMAASSPLIPCLGDPITLSVNRTPGLYYQWTKNGSDIAGAIDTAYTIAAMTQADSGVYQVSITANNCVLLSRSTELNPNICGNPFALAIDLVRFTGQVNNNGNAVLNWTIAKPEPNGKFEVLYSTNGKNFVPAGTVYQQGENTSFGFTHNNYVIQGKAYYKLLMTESDGKLKHSNVLVLNHGSALEAQSQLSAAPIPFSNTLTVTYFATEAGTVQASIADVSGRIIKIQQVEVAAGSNAFTVANLENLNNGVYLLSVANAHGEKQHIKIQK